MRVRTPLLAIDVWCDGLYADCVELANRANGQYPTAHVKLFHSKAAFAVIVRREQRGLKNFNRSGQISSFSAKNSYALLK